MVTNYSRRYRFYGKRRDIVSKASTLRTMGGWLPAITAIIGAIVMGIFNVLNNYVRGKIEYKNWIREKISRNVEVVYELYTFLKFSLPAQGPLKEEKEQREKFVGLCEKMNNLTPTVSYFDDIEIHNLWNEIIQFLGTEITKDFEKLLRGEKPSPEIKVKFPERLEKLYKLMKKALR